MPELQLTVPADLAESQAVRSATREFFLAAGFDPKTAGRLVLVADELFMNAVKYGSQPGDSVAIAGWIQDGGVQFSVADFNRRNLTTDDFAAIIEHRKNNLNLHATSGRGIALILREWTDSHEFHAEPGKLSFSFFKKLDSAMQPATAMPKSDSAAGPVFALTGELDELSLAAQSGPIESALETSSTSSIMLDLTAVPFLNSSAIGRIVGWHVQLESRGGGLAIRGAQPEVYDILDLVGATSLMSISPLSS